MADGAPAESAGNSRAPPAGSGRSGPAGRGGPPRRGVGPTRGAELVQKTELCAGRSAVRLLVRLEHGGGNPAALVDREPALTSPLADRRAVLAPRRGSRRSAGRAAAARVRARGRTAGGAPCVADIRSESVTQGLRVVLVE